MMHEVNVLRLYGNGKGRKQTPNKKYLANILLNCQAFWDKTAELQERSES